MRQPRNFVWDRTQPNPTDLTVPDRATRVLELDGIRGVAIGLVLLWHYFVLPAQTVPGTFLSYLQACGRLTWTGVDLFFVLSGFLIGGILLDSRESPNFFRTFYIRRFFRIVPLYLVWLSLMCLILHFARAGKFSPALNEYMLRDRFTMVPYMFYLQNFWMAAKDTLGWYSSGGTWSLAIEEQFYLTLPLIVRFTTRQRLVRLVAAAAIAAPILRTMIFLLAPHHRMAAFALMPCRADSLLLGVLGAMLVRNEKWHARVQRNRGSHIALVVVLILGAAWLGKDAVGTLDLQMVTVGYTWMASLYLLILLFAVIHSGSWLAVVLRWGWLRWLGGIAYGLYLYHFQVYVAVFGLLWHVPPERVTDIWGLAACFGALAITLAICRLSWNYFERPLIAVGHRFKY